MRRWVRILLIALAALAVAVGAAWVLTPSGTDVQPAVVAAASARHTVLLQPGEVPGLLADAIVATEDERFYQHHGIDLVGLGRSILYDISHLCACQGGSTITEQLVKISLLGGNDSGLKKLEDAVVAFKTETVLSKRRILADYLSAIPTGPQLYGVSAAACTYFNRPLDQLDLAQYAELAGLPQAPSAYDPLTSPHATAARRHQVLQAMVSEEMITEAQARAADQEPVTASGPGC